MAAERRAVVGELVEIIAMQEKPILSSEYYAFEQFGDIVLFDIDKLEVMLVNGLAGSSLSPSLHNSLASGLHFHGEPSALSEEVALILTRLQPPEAPSVTRLDNSTSPHGNSIHTMALNVAEDCNLCCRYCYRGPGPFGLGTARMSESTAERAIDFFLDLSGDAVNRIYFFGGEPLLNPGIIFHVQRYARRRFEAKGKIVHFFLVTNGTLITPELSEQLLETDIQLLVGIDGLPHVHNALRYGPGRRATYEDIVPRLTPWIKARRIGAVIVLSEFGNNLIGIVEHLRSIGFQDFVFRLPMSLVEDADRWIEGKLNLLKGDLSHFARYYLSELIENPNEPRWRLHRGDIFYNYLESLVLKRRRNYPCGAGLCEIGVSCNGDVYPCPYFTGLTEFRVGSVSCGIDWKGMSKFLEAGALPREQSCADCWARYLCGGGCLRDRLGATGSISLPNPYKCEIIKHIIRLSVFIYAHLQKEFNGNVGLHLTPGLLGTFQKMSREMSGCLDGKKHGK